MRVQRFRQPARAPAPIDDPLLADSVIIFQDINVDDKVGARDDTWVAGLRQIRADDVERGWRRLPGGFVVAFVP